MSLIGGLIRDFIMGCIVDNIYNNGTYCRSYNGFIADIKAGVVVGFYLCVCAEKMT